MPPTACYPPALLARSPLARRQDSEGEERQLGSPSTRAEEALAAELFEVNCTRRRKGGSVAGSAVGSAMQPLTGSEGGEEGEDEEDASEGEASGGEEAGHGLLKARGTTRSSPVDSPRLVAPRFTWTKTSNLAMD